MKTLLIAIVIQLASTFALAQDQPIEAGWKNMKVFETKRDDVNKTLGKSFAWGDVMIYGSQPESVWVFYSKGPCVASSDAVKYNIEKDTVVGYRIFFFRDFLLTDLKWKQDDYSRQTIGRAFRYANKDASIQFVTFPVGDNKESVTVIEYSPTEEQKKKYLCSQ